MPRIRLLLIFLLGLSALAPAGALAAATRPATLGIADQKATMFTDERFEALGLRYARLAVPWDVLRYDFTRKDADDWLQAARRTGVRPLVTFQRSRVRSSSSRPTVEQYRREIVRFRRAYPWVREYAAWNEANLEDSRRPKLIASYYKTLRTACPGCKVLGADLIDRANVVSWVRRFQSYVPKAKRPKYWGLHNYISANRFSTKDTRALQREIKGSRLWITETGGLVARRNRSVVKLAQGKAHAAKVTGFILRTWVRTRQVDRVYLYHWDSESTKDTWDSAFIGPDGKARPALDVLRSYLRTNR